MALTWQMIVTVVLPLLADDAIAYHVTIAADRVQQGDIASPISACAAGSSVVTGAGRPIDDALAATDGFVLRYDDEIRVWGPAD